MAPPRAANRRISWQQVPDRVRDAVEAVLGASVVEALTQEGGFSPGAAARLRLANGRSAFVKAIGIDLHPNSAGLYRREAATMPHLPAGLPVPRLLDVYDDGNWIALVYEEVNGRHPELPWRLNELQCVADAITNLGAALQPSPWREGPGFVDANGAFLRAWEELAAEPPTEAEPWLRRHLDQLAAQEIDVAELFGGDALLHNDIRSDNVLLTPDGGVVFLDWGATCNGAEWLDVVLFALSVNAEGGADAEMLVRGHPLTRDVAASWIDVVLLAAVATYWRQSRLPEDPLLPGSRAYQVAYADATVRWMKRRLPG
jgi:serine/threonine protein kinase